MQASQEIKKGEIHYPPEPPEGQTTVKSKKDHETMLLEVQKRDPDVQLLDIGDEPLISAVMDR